MQSGNKIFNLINEHGIRNEETYNRIKTSKEAVKYSKISGQNSFKIKSGSADDEISITVSRNRSCVDISISVSCQQGTIKEPVRKQMKEQTDKAETEPHEEIIKQVICLKALTLFSNIQFCIFFVCQFEKMFIFHVTRINFTQQ